MIRYTTAGELVESPIIREVTVQHDAGSVHISVNGIIIATLTDNSMHLNNQAFCKFNLRVEWEPIARGCVS